jgi:predicted lipoprotein with Yx(FWY)xxD motif
MLNRPDVFVVSRGMALIKRLAPFLGLVLAAATACGSGSSGGTQKVSTQGSGGNTSAAVVATKSGSNGTYLTDGKGMTLYLFEADKTSASTCSSACASYWPPYTTTGAPTVSGDADQSKVGTSKRSDGTTQVTYAGHPLYHFAQDSSPGDTKGQGSDNFGAEWYIVAPDGSTIEKGDGSGDDSGSSSRGSYY